MRTMIEMTVRDGEIHLLAAIALWTEYCSRRGEAKPLNGQRSSESLRGSA